MWWSLFLLVGDAVSRNRDVSAKHIKQEGPPVTCLFDRHGNNLKKNHGNEKECKGIKIMKPGYGYGYAHGHNYRYRVRIETGKGFINNEGPGDYTITLNADDSDPVKIKLKVKDSGNKGK